MWGLFFYMKNYQETVEWLFNQLPMYQQQGAIAYKADLSNTLLLAKHLRNPEKKLKTIHVAGTNGKGSTSSLLASVLREAGYQVGLFTSPHLKDYRERIKINGNEIEEDFANEFEYELTIDQVHAIEDVKKDMEAKQVMDRLICGDVGYGKTEVALRAILKAIVNKKQAAFRATCFSSAC